MDDPFGTFKERILEWANAQPGIRAIVVTGSRSRHDGSVDEWSDLDVQLIVNDPGQFTTNHDWIYTIGDVWICFAPENDPAVPNRLVWYRGGKKIDYSFHRVDDVYQQIDTQTLSDEYQRGYEVLLDKDNLFSKLPPSPNRFPPQPAPTQAEFTYAVEQFWFEGIHVGQFLRRREVWVVKFRNWNMKLDLLKMMEWHARVTHTEPVNTWLIGKKIAEWTDAGTWKAIHGIWSGYDVYGNWHALLNLLELFSRLSREVAECLGYDYEAERYEEIHQYLKGLYAGDPITSLPEREQEIGDLCESEDSFILTLSKNFKFDSSAYSQLNNLLVNYTEDVENNAYVSRQVFGCLFYMHLILMDVLAQIDETHTYWREINDANAETMELLERLTNPVAPKRT